MDYRTAGNIRGSSLSSLMTDKILSGKGVGSALSGAISDKFKARATGVKEKFDPMNIAKFMTGGSRLGPAIMGKLTGRSQSDINYFAGNKKSKGSYTQVPTSLSTPGEGLGGSAINVLSKMLAFMMKSREQDVKKKETAKQFIEEQKVEEQRRQDEFLKLLKEYTSLSGGTTFVKVGQENDPLDSFKKMLDAFKQKFENMIDAINVFKNAKALTSLIGLLTNPLGLTIGAILAATYGLKKLAEYTPNYSILTPQEAQNVLRNGTQGDIEKAGGYDKLADIIKNRPGIAKQALEDYKTGKISEIELNKLGGKDRLEQTVKETGLAIPEKKAMLEKVVPRPEKRGYQQIQWDNLYGKDYDAKTGFRKDLVGPHPSVGPVVAPSTTPMPETPAGNTGGKMQPVPQTPVSSRMNDAIGENQTLNLAGPGNTQTPSAPIISTNTSSVDQPDRPIPATATVRDRTPILDHVLQLSVSPV